MFKKISKLSLTILTTAIILSLFSGCANEYNEENITSTVDQSIKYNINSELLSIDPALNGEGHGATVISNTFEGLLRYDEKNKLVAGVAERWERSSDGLNYTFSLRKNAKWSDGEPVTAMDFVYAWRRALNQETAASKVYHLYPLKNGEKYNSGLAEAEEVGVKAKDDYTLEVTLENPTQYFLSLTALPIYFPVREDIVEKKDWTLRPKTYVGNGPFKLMEWIAQESLTVIKNEYYWDAKKVKLESIEFSMIKDLSSYTEAFTSGDLDIIESPSNQDTQELLKEGLAKTFPYLGTYFYCINVSDKAKEVDSDLARVLSDVKVRKALNLAINRDIIVTSATMGKYTPAYSFVPKGIMESKDKDFASIKYYNPVGDVEEAKRLLSEAGYPNGTGFPKVALSYNTDEIHGDVAKAIQDMWKNNLNIEVELRAEEWEAFQNNLNEKKYILSKYSFIADYADPINFLDMWTSKSERNAAGYNNGKYDELVASAKRELNSTKRIEYLHQAEAVLMEDMPVLPIYYYTNIMCIKETVKDVIKSPLGFVFFNKAYVVEE